MVPPGRALVALALTLSPGIGCNSKDGVEDDSSLVDTDTDTDSDSDADSDTDTDTDSDSGTELDCQASPATPSPGHDSLPACITDNISCGETVVGTTVGGSTHYDSTGYDDGACLNVGENYSAPERVYSLTVPAHNAYTVTAHVCPGLKLRRVYGLGSTSCPTLNFQNGATCEQAFDRGGGLQELTATNGQEHDLRYELVIDGKDGATGSYSLSVECFPD